MHVAASFPPIRASFAGDVTTSIPKSPPSESIDSKREVSSFTRSLALSGVTKRTFAFVPGPDVVSPLDLNAIPLDVNPLFGEEKVPSELFVTTALPNFDDQYYG